ncbi:MAG: lysophospholipid acyltransferase family protein [Acholeplasmataceae bacterium]
MITLLFFACWTLIIYFFTTIVDSLYLLPVWFVLGYFIAVIAVILIIVLHLPFVMLSKPNNRYKHYVTRSLAFWANRFLLHLSIKVEGKENVPKTGRLTIYANHKSYVDPLLILEIIKRPTTFTPKSALYKIPVLKQWLESIACFKIDRSNTRDTARSMIDAINTVKSEVAMTIFPEGGIKDRDEEKMVDMRAGAYKVGLKAKAELLPIRIFGTTEVKKRAPLRNTKIRVVILPVIKYDEVKDLNTTEVADMVMQRINAVEE